MPAEYEDVIRDSEDGLRASWDLLRSPDAATWTYAAATAPDDGFRQRWITGMATATQWDCNQWIIIRPLAVEMQEGFEQFETLMFMSADSIARLSVDLRRGEIVHPPEADEPAEPGIRGRALWLRQHRNTGPVDLRRWARR